MSSNNKEEVKEVDWKVVAFELANILDDVRFGTEILTQSEKITYQDSPFINFLQKNFRKSDKYFMRYRGSQILHINDYLKEKESDELRMKMMMDVFTTTKTKTNE